ncbi:DUF805 domain-containing protein [Aquibium sp. A9E412]|uniref:DUF805 domain-containing protein n=1 Tax=Aquibium sp. A9E412 TaxID=2976767 RepID=UPI0025AF1016|nr:DUF805 domain-containing protein [Aquibium sp. A9E412]MDN2566271.1 DUF805 domain-containing protein [Aquibium sp. A9E412]
MSGRQILWLFFGFSGRVSRAAYFLAGLLLVVLQMFFLYRFALAPQESPASETWALGFWVILLVSMWSYVALGVKRLHDFGKPGIFALSLFIPVVSIIAFILFCIYPGDEGANQYGTRTNAER